MKFYFLKYFLLHKTCLEPIKKRGRPEKRKRGPGRPKGSSSAKSSTPIRCPARRTTDREIEVFSYLIILCLTIFCIAHKEAHTTN